MRERDFEASEHIWNKFLEIDSSKLNYEDDLDDNVDIDKLMKSELGNYIWCLINLVIEGKIETEAVK